MPKFIIEITGDMPVSLTYTTEDAETEEEAKKEALEFAGTASFAYWDDYGMEAHNISVASINLIPSLI